jgi:hypothetical protein
MALELPLITRDRKITELDWVQTIWSLPQVSRSRSRSTVQACGCTGEGIWAEEIPGCLASGPLVAWASRP